MEEDRIDTIYEKLQTLRQWDTVSVFSQALYELIAERLTAQGAAASGVTIAFADFLAAETNYHRRLAVLAQRDQMQLSELQALAERRRFDLDAVADAIAHAAAGSRELRGIQHLLLAECYYHQRRSTEVVDQLRRAINCGITDRLVQFALGYNVYTLALEQFGALRGDKHEIHVTDQVAFQEHCLSAIAVLEGSLGGDAFDAQVYWWLSHIMESAGMADAARDVQDAMADTLGEGGSEVPDGGFPSEHDEAVAAPDYLPQITASEVREAGELLRGRFSLSEVLGHEPRDD
ncbi:MAG TPA: hypothetical protein DGT21_16630 [Armatimonadetes bacterium]|jgi:hypothetical protein|nr:hypothetical protein [Armatimonadota bacterium]